MQAFREISRLGKPDGTHPEIEITETLGIEKKLIH